METFTELFPSVHDLLSLKEALGKLAGKIERKRDFFKKNLNSNLKVCERQIKTNPTTIIENSQIIYSCLQ